MSADTRARRHPVTAAEPFASRWKRRARTVPLMLSATAVGVLASPVLLTGAALLDLAKGRFRLPTVRVTLFLLQYGINDSAEILLAPVYWMLGGFGTRFDQPASIARHERLRRWSIDVLGRRAEQLLGLRLDIDPDTAALLTPGPVIVLCRHVNIVDASLPTLLYQKLGFRTAGVIMAELLADPGFDLIYGRTGSVFIPRDNGPDAIAKVRTLGQSIDSTTAVVIFPEGRLFRRDRLERAKKRLAAESPNRAARLNALSHVLPPRPGGVLALIDTIPADVVVIAHTGLDQYASFTELAKAVPLRSPIRVTAWRVHESRFRTGTSTASPGSTNSGCSSTMWSQPRHRKRRSSPLSSHTSQRQDPQHHRHHDLRRTGIDHRDARLRRLTPPQTSTRHIPIHQGLT